MTPIENILSRYIKPWSDDFMRFCHDVRQARGQTTLVDVHKERLGSFTSAQALNAWKDYKLRMGF